MVVCAAVADLRNRRIPNLLTLPAIVLGWLLWMPDTTPKQFASVAGVTLVTFVAGLLLFSVGVIGGGDGKLLTAVAAIAGSELFVECAIWTLIFGVIVSVVLLAARGALTPLVARLVRGVAELLLYRSTAEPLVGPAQHQIAYGAVIAGGVLSALVATHAGFNFIR